MTHRSPLLRTWRGALRCLALLVLLGTTAIAAPTDPVMVLAQGERSANWIGVTGEFPAEALVQAPLGVQVLVRDLASGTRFVRFELGVGAFEGNEAALADGLDPLEAMVISSAGNAVSAPLLFVGPARLELLLPSGFPAGQVEVQLFAIDATGAVLSNPLTVTGGAL